MRFMHGPQYNAGLLDWAAMHGKTFDFRDPANSARAIGVVSGNKLVATCIYHHFRPNVPDIEMTILADTPRWCTKGAVRFLLSYPFVQLGCVRVTALIGRKNKRSRRFVEGIGFKLEGTARRAWDGRQDCMVYGLLRDECRWLTENENGQEERRVA